MKVLIQHLRATNDTNGNPRRVFAVYDMNTGDIIEVIEEGYQGSGAYSKKYPDHIMLPDVVVSPSEISAFKNSAQ